MASTRDRCRGLLLGLCAGDRNGGPQRLALRLAEAAHCDNPVAAGLRRYLSWESPHSTAGTWAARVEALPPETEASFDTGAIFELVIPKVREWVEGCLADGQPIADAALLACAEQKAMQAFLERGSAGVSPAHRNAIYAAVQRFSVTQIVEICVAETRITHLHPEAVATSVGTALLCRSLIEGASLQQSALAALPFLPEDAPDTLRVMRAAAEGLFAHPTHKDGYSPLVLESALHFVGTYRTFGSALLQSIQFAGPENYCPVLVGALAGAMHGDSTRAAKTEVGVRGVVEAQLMHKLCEEPHRSRVHAVADDLARLWHD